MLRHTLFRVSTAAFARRIPVYTPVRCISLSDLGPLQELLKKPELLKAGMDLMKNDGRSMQEKMNEILQKNPDLAKAMQDPGTIAAMQKVMQDETVRKGVEPYVNKFMNEMKEKDKKV